MLCWLIVYYDVYDWLFLKFILVYGKISIGNLFDGDVLVGLLIDV